MMKKVKYLCFDMDGTIADLYGVENWEAKLNAHDVEPYAVATPLCDMARLNALLERATAKKIKIVIITWLAKNTNRQYNKEVRKAKKIWLEKNGIHYTKFCGRKYGTTKADCVRAMLPTNRTAILIDDNAKVRKGWNLGGTVDPTKENFLDILEKIIEKN